MKPFAAAAESAVRESRLSLDDLAVFARWRTWRVNERYRGVATRSELLRWSAGTRSPGSLQMIVKVVRALDPRSPDLPPVEAARLQKERSYTGRLPSSSNRDAPRRVAVREDELPPDWRAALTAMREGARGASGKPTPAPSIVVTIGQKLCQLAWSSRRAGLPIALDRRQLHCFIADMEARKLSQRTVVTTLGKIRDFLDYTGWSPELRRDCQRQQQFHGKNAVAEPKRKELFLARSGLGLPDIASAAGDALAAIPTAESTPTRLRLCNDAALCALAVAMAPRLADVSRLVVGDTVCRNGDGWHVVLSLQKTGERHFVPIDPRLNEYLDEAILHGTDPAFFWDFYRRREGTTFLVTDAAGRPAAYHYPTQRFRSLFGVGLHIVRTLWHDWASGQGPEGLEQALAVCGHRSPRAREHYETVHGVGQRVRSAQALVSMIAADACSTTPPVNGRNRRALTGSQESCG
jgi:integrase